MDKSSSLGMSPGHPKKYPRGSSVKAWGCPRHPLFLNKKAPGHFSMRYIFIASCIMCYSWSIFIFCCVFTVFNKVGPHHILFWRETRSAVLHHVYLGVRHAPPILHMNALFLLLLFCECSSLLVLCLALSFSLLFFSELFSLLASTSLIFMFIIYESYFIIWLTVELEEKKFLAYSGAN